MIAAQPVTFLVTIFRWFPWMVTFVSRRTGAAWPAVPVLVGFPAAGIVRSP